MQLGLYLPVEDTSCVLHRDQSNIEASGFHRRTLPAETHPGSVLASPIKWFPARTLHRPRPWRTKVDSWPWN